MDKKLQAAVRALVNTYKIAEAARRLGVSRESVTRIVAGMTVRAGTLALVRSKLGEARNG
jgi:hypothetical protein